MSNYSLDARASTTLSKWSANTIKKLQTTRESQVESEQLIGMESKLDARRANKLESKYLPQHRVSQLKHLLSWRISPELWFSQFSASHSTSHCLLALQWNWISTSVRKNIFSSRLRLFSRLVLCDKKSIEMFVEKCKRRSVNELSAKSPFCFL